ncbi:MAG: TPR end-of-group domain-containing protein, partial [Bryobacteraceae bacterium]
MAVNKSSQREKTPEETMPPASRAGDGRAAQAPDLEQQARLFEEGIRLMQAEEFLEARARFEAAARGPSVEMAHAARQRVRMCELRLARQEPVLRTSEDHYTYAIVLLNQRRAEEAENHLRKALEENPRGDHLYYALALCRCLRGDPVGAFQCMQRAIELDPNNRITARNDPDFAPFLDQAPLAELF